MAEPIFSPKIKRGNGTCLMCTNEVTRRQVKVKLGVTGWDKFKKDAENWSALDIPPDDSFHIYTEVHEKICNSEGPFGIVHNSCRASFGTKHNSCLETATNNAQTPPVKGRLRSSSTSVR